MKICFRLPNWLGDVCMALPVIKAIQEHTLTTYPDAKFTFLTQSPYIDLLDKLGIEGEKIPLPKKNVAYFFHFLKMRFAKSGRFDKHILFTNSERGDLEAWIMGSTQRYGITRPNKPRKLLTHRYELRRDFDEEALHQTNLWRDFTAHFDLHDGLDVSPCLEKSRDFQNRQNNPNNTLHDHVNNDLNYQNDTSNEFEHLIKSRDFNIKAIGLICGSANTPEKRWAVENWQTLVHELLSRDCERIVLIGTKDDIATCEKVATFINDVRVENWAGKTNLAELTDVMRDLSLVIGNDTGGLHIANALGVPVIGLYGYTNPVRCHPIFDAPLAILQSPKGYGEGIMDDITPKMILQTL